MGSKSGVANSYANFFYKNSDSGAINQKAGSCQLTALNLGVELQLFRALFINSPKLIYLLSDPSVAQEDKIKMILSFFPKVSNPTKALLMLLHENGHLLLVPKISEKFSVIAFNLEKKIDLLVAMPLNINNKTAMQQVFPVPGATIAVTYSPKLGSGFCLKYNSMEQVSHIDSSLVRQLAKLLGSLKN